MSQSPILPSYTELAMVLHKNQPETHPAQIHGLICGYLCVLADKMKDLFFSGANKNHELKEILSQVYEGTYRQLSEFSFEFNLLLPDDDTDINIRAEALGLWSQGFLTGLSNSGISIENHEHANVKEAMDDIVEIANINFGDIVANEEDESAYFELVEYVRLSVLMIFHELRPDTLEVDKGREDKSDAVH